MKQASLYFTAPRCVEIREKNLPSPSGREVLVKTLFGGEFQTVYESITFADQHGRKERVR